MGSPLLPINCGGETKAAWNFEYIPDARRGEALSRYLSICSERRGYQNRVVLAKEANRKLGRGDAVNIFFRCPARNTVDISLSQIERRTVCGRNEI